MPILTKPSFGPRTAIIYITAGALIDVWVAVWWWFNEGLSNRAQFWLVGLFLTGLTLILIGAFLGSIGRAARKVEMPPVSVTDKEAVIQQTAAANPPVMLAPAPGAAPQVGVPATQSVPSTPAGYAARR